jgi:hypothetical protein
MKLTDQEFKTLFKELLEPPVCMGCAEKEAEKWQEGYLFALSQVYALVIDEADANRRFNLNDAS